MRLLREGWRVIKAITLTELKNVRINVIAMPSRTISYEPRMAVI